MTKQRFTPPHTPGPWIVEVTKGRRGRPATLCMVVAAAGGMPGLIVNQGPVETRDLANASLIAAAPDLLKALQWLFAVCLQEQLLPDTVSYMQEAEKAIAKALGE